MKIDIATHVMLPRYKECLYKHGDKFTTERAVQERRPTLTDMTERLRILDQNTGMVQVITTTMPPVEEIVGPAEAAEMARICNDEMAEMIAKHPKKFTAAVANLPFNDMDATLKEAERAIRQLGFKGVQIYTSINGRPLGSEDLMPLYEMMSGYDLPIWIHPNRHSYDMDYSTETTSHNQIFSIFGGPYDTTAAMIRLVFAGVFERFPGIKLITHHCGGMIPFFADRLVLHYNNGLQRLGSQYFPGLTKHPIDYLRMFYADTALGGGPSALRCGLDFFGEDHLLFGTDMPYDVENGTLSIKLTINAIEALGLPDSTLIKIYEENARSLLNF
jgi:predicted TIM-barrel fold metal-dependent hydrolase